MQTTTHPILARKLVPSPLSKCKVQMVASSRSERRELLLSKGHTLVDILTLE